MVQTLERPMVAGEAAVPRAEAGRLARLRAHMTELDVDTFLVSNPHNRRYLTGFTGHDDPPLDTAGLLLVTPDKAILITDGRYDTQAQGEVQDIEIVVRQGKLKDVLVEQITALGSKRVGVEANHLLLAYYEDLREGLPAVTLVSTRRAIELQRHVKDAAELELLRQAIAISDAAFLRVMDEIRPGMTEREVAQRLDRAMLDFGAEGSSFGTIVAGGPNGAMAHAVPGERPIQEGEPVVIDMGAVYQGYHSDSTRTIVLGTPDARFHEIYAIVLAAKQAAEAALRAGLSGVDADKIARDVIEAAGYGPQFAHSLGHGVGLEIHEGPNMSRFSEDTALPAGAVISVEPGIYIPDWGGIRLEDLVLIEDDGVEVLSHVPMTFHF